MKELTDVACHIVSNEYSKILRITFCDIQSKDIMAYSLVWKNIIVVMAKNSVSKDFMVDGAQANWIDGKGIDHVTQLYSYKIESTPMCSNGRPTLKKLLRSILSSPSISNTIM